MELNEYVVQYNAQAKINKLARLYKNKKVAIYGAGQFAQVIFENYDLSGLNIIAIADKKFEDENQRSFFNYNCISPNELVTIDCDLILIANFDYQLMLSILDGQVLYGTKNAKVEIRPLINLTFKDLFKKRIRGHNEF